CGVVVSLVERGAGKDLAKTMKGTGLNPKVTPPDVRSLKAPAQTATRPTASREEPRPQSVEAAPTDPLRAKGVVASFHPKRGFGFIDQGTGTDLFVHHSNTASPIATGQRVAFAVRE